MKYASGWWLLVCLILSISAHATNVVVTPPYTNDSFDTSEIPPTATPAEQSERVWDAITDMWIREGVDLSKCNMTMQYYAIGQYSDGRVERQNYSGSCGGYTTIFGAVNGKGYLLKRINKHPHNGKGCNCVNGQVSAGDPIEIGTGNTYLKETDFNGGDPRLQFSRSYNSNASARNSTVGMGWTSTLDTHVVPFWADMIDPYGGIDTSGVYADPNGACISGFAEIAAKQPEIFAGYSAQWIPPGNGSGPGICGIFNPLGVVTAYWPILSNDDSILLPNAQSPYLTGMVVYRDDGSTYEFTCANGGCLPDPNVPLQMAVDSSGHFLLTDADGVIDLFDSTGSIVSRTWKDRYQQTVSPNQDGTLKTISDTSGRSIALSYIDGFLTTVNTPDGQVISYTQDASGNLLTKHSATGTRTYQYANASFPNNLTGVVDEDTATNGGNPFTTWSYDTAGLANGSAGYGGVNQVSIVHNSDGSATVTDPLNTVRTYSYQTNFGVPAITAISGGFCANCGGEAFDTYDISGYLATATDWNNNVKSYTFASGLLTQLVEGDGTPSKRTTAINWDQVLRNPLEETVTDASNLKLKVDWQYNGAGTQIARCEEDPTVTGATSYVCSSTGTVPAGVRRWTYSYCNAVVPGTQCPVLGLLEVSTDPLGHATSYSYFASDDSTCASNPAACPHRAGDLNTITNPLGQVVTLLAYDGAGRVLKMTDTNNVETDLTYNSRGGLVQIATRAINGQVGPGDQTTSFQYDNAGQLTQVTEGNGAFSVFKYDVAHRLTDIADNLGDDIHYTLDKAGNRMEDDTRDPSGTVKRSVQRVFNNLGQLQIIANANVSPQTSPSYTFSYDPNGNPTGLLNGRGYTTTASFDPLNRIAAVVQDPNVGGGTHVNANTALTLDALDRATVVQDPQGLPTQYNYDGLNDLIQLTSPDTGTTINTFDAAGNLKTRTDARGVKATYVYDVLNRVTAINYTPASTPSTNMSFVYDNTQSMCNQTTEAFGAGRLTQMHNASGTTNFCYDRFGRMVHKQQGIAGVAFVTTYAYDLGNRLIQATTPGGTVINYTRDALGRVTAVSYHLKGKTTFTNLVTNVTYYPYGPVASITYADGRVLTRTYDQNYYINGVTDTANGGLNLTFVPDLLGNIVQENAGSSGNILNYDALNRLTNVNDLSNNPVWAYTYDGTGNRLSKQAGTAAAVPYTYPTTSHQLIAVGNTPRGYDLAGNTTSTGSGSGSQGFVFDNTNRMSQLNNSAGAAVMQYATNPIGQRVEKYLAGNASLTQYRTDDEAGRELGTYDNTSTRVRETVWMDGMPVAVISGSTGTLSYIEPDQIGTPRTAIDGTSNAVKWNWSPVNDPFGETQPTGSLALNLRMPGQSFDAESGLNYNYFRDYDPTTGRYVESDPIGLAGGISTYTYVQSHPLQSADPSGQNEVVNYLYGTAIGASFAGGLAEEGDSRTAVRISINSGSAGELTKFSANRYWGFSDFGTEAAGDAVGEFGAMAMQAIDDHELPSAGDWGTALAKTVIDVAVNAALDEVPGGAVVAPILSNALGADVDAARNISNALSGVNFCNSESAQIKSLMESGDIGQDYFPPNDQGPGSNWRKIFGVTRHY